MERREDPRLSVFSAYVRKPCSADAIQGPGNSCQDRKTRAATKSSSRMCEERRCLPRPFGFAPGGGLISGFCLNSASLHFLSFSACAVYGINRYLFFKLSPPAIPTTPPHTHTRMHTHTDTYMK